MLAAKIHEVTLHESSHFNDALSHPFDLSEPLLVQGWIVEDFGSNAGTMNWRIRVQWPN
jgi:hypothetical protein